VAEGIRLQKVLADAGVASRRHAEMLIAAGRVAVDGTTASLGQRVDPSQAKVTVDGRPIGGRAETLHLLLAKPAGVTSTVSDRHAARTVVELIPAELRRDARLYPVGRLDRDSEGLILLTNDGAWAERVIHPRHGMEREYAVGLIEPLDGSQEAMLQGGIQLEEGLATLAGLRPLRPAELDRLAMTIGRDARELHWYRVVLEQGWKRQVRRMFTGAGTRVERLVRTRIGHLRLDGMRLGEVRVLSADEAGTLAGSARSADPRRLVVAVDGPGGSGKSTVGAAVATRLGYRFCDTGVLYRGLTWLAIEAGADYDDPAQLLSLVPRMELAPDDAERYVFLLADGRDVTAELHTAGVDLYVSRVSRHEPVRAALLPIQRSLAIAGGIVMAGRDIGSVVLPEADLKVYLEVSIAERTRRRASDRGLEGDADAMALIEQELRRRDGIDSTRETAPLRVPEGAVVINTERNTLEQTVDEVVALVERTSAR
jgi:cytidylate kinase